MIPQSFIQDLLGRVDIVDVIGSSVQLKRAGANLAACCPFHSEKSPSFTVSPTKQFYHCFGCGAHGTAISFLMEYHGMGFIDAVKDLAARAGMEVPEQQRSDAQRKEEHRAADLTEVMAKAARFYKDQLKRTPGAVDYLKGRGLTGEVAARYGIGYAPDGWQSLGAVFGDYNAPELLEGGLVIQNDEGRRYDRFRDRIMFPIVNPRGDIIGFGGRVLGQGEPKYLNSPETPIFEKGRELYGLFQARRAIRQENLVIVVEGYMDVVALAQHGVENAVATLGTATTPVHVQKLLRQADRIVFCFDGDAAGRRAAWRALEVCLPVLTDGKQAGFLFLPDPEDPDSFVRKFGKPAFEALVRDSEPLSRYLIRELRGRVDMDTAEGKAAFLKEAEGLVRQITAPNLGRTMRVAMAKEADLPIPDQAVAPGRSRTGGSGAPPAPRRSASVGLADKVLLALIGNPKLHDLARRAAEIAPSSGQWALVQELVTRISAGDLLPISPAIFHYLQETDRGEIAASLASRLLELTQQGAVDFEPELLGAVDQMEQKLRRSRWEEIAKTAKTVGELPPEARDLISGAGRS